MPNPPKDPGYFDKVNYVINAWSRPCEAPWYIYVETMKPAALKAFITLITFGWDDVFRGYFRPRGLGGRRTGKRKGKYRFLKPRFPELGELIGKNLPGAYEVKGEQWSRLGKTLWRIDTVIQRALFWWLVADVTIDFAYEWTSVLYETRWCQESDKGRFSVREDPNQLVPGNTWWNLSFTQEDYRQPPPIWLVIRGQAGATGAIVTAAASVRQFGSDPPPGSIGIRIINTTTGVVVAQTGPSDTSGDNGFDMPVMGDVAPFAEFQVQAWHDVPFAYVHKAVVIGMEP